jgi:prephenate dehydrogenase
MASRIGPETLVADTCSVKVYPARWMREILPPATPLLATHPMFGPESAKDGLDELAIMMDPLRLDPALARFWEDTFASFGLTPVVMDCDRHDREAAYSQALTHFVGRSLHRLGLADTPIATRWYRKLHSVVKQCVRDSMDLFEDMQTYNPYAAGMRKELMACFQKTLQELESPGPAEFDQAKSLEDAAACAAENAMDGGLR